MVGASLGVEREGVPTNQWAGHLVVIVPNVAAGKYLLCDLTLGQVNKPEWGIELPPKVFVVTEAFVRGAQDSRITANGCSVLYKAFSSDHSYDGFPVWSDAPRQDESAKRILEALA